MKITLVVLAFSLTLMHYGVSNASCEVDPQEVFQGNHETIVQTNNKEAGRIKRKLDSVQPDESFHQMSTEQLERIQRINVASGSQKRPVMAENSEEPCSSRPINTLSKLGEVIKKGYEDSPRIERAGKDFEDDPHPNKEKEGQQELDSKEPAMAGTKSGEEVQYVGAVLEYEPYDTWTNEEKGYGVLRENAEAIIGYAKQAKQQAADILIAPEYGLQSLDMFYSNTENFLTYTVYVPEPVWQFVPCSYANSTDNFEAMKILSCGARDNQIYLVVDLAELYPCAEDTIAKAPWQYPVSDDCPEEGFIAYNAQVVFDRSGAVVAKYRKQALYLEDSFTPGPPDDSTAIFVTDFNVAFSLQICFEIVYTHPGYSNVKNFGIKDVAMSTAWVDELPFDLADANQNGWSRGLRVNLLVSGYHDPENYKLGSGIFPNYLNGTPVYSYNKNSGNVLLVSPITTISASSLSLNLHRGAVPKESVIHKSHHELAVDSLVNFEIREENRTQFILHQNLSEYTRVLLTQEEPNSDPQNITACSNDDFCCDLTYSYSGNLVYYFFVFSGLKPVGGGSYYIGVQHCAIIWCVNSSYSTCAVTELGLPESDTFGPFKLSSSSFSIDSVYPIGNHRDFSLLSNDNFVYENSGNYSSVSSVIVTKDLLVGALFGRWYSRDRSG